MQHVCPLVSHPPLQGTHAAAPAPATHPPPFFQSMPGPQAAQASTTPASACEPMECEGSDSQPPLKKAVHGLEQPQGGGEGVPGPNLVLLPPAKRSKKGEAKHSKRGEVK